MSETPSDATPPSARWPWLRSLLYSFVVALSPAVWVVETQSCSGSGGETRELSGADLFAQLDVEDIDQLWIGALFVLMLAAPFLAWRARTPLRRFAWHGVSLLGAAFGALATFTLVMFVLFASRIVRPVGYVVLALSLVPVVESIVRLVLGWREHRIKAAGP